FDWGTCTAHISANGMALGGTPSNLVRFPPGTRNRCGLGCRSACVGFYLLQLRVTGPPIGWRQGTRPFSFGRSLYCSWIKSVNGLIQHRGLSSGFFALILRNALGASNQIAVNSARRQA